MDINKVFEKIQLGLDNNSNYSGEGTSYLDLLPKLSSIGGTPSHDSYSKVPEDFVTPSTPHTWDEATYNSQQENKILHEQGSITFQDLDNAGWKDYIDSWLKAEGTPLFGKVHRKTEEFMYQGNQDDFPRVYTGKEAQEARSRADNITGGGESIKERFLYPYKDETGKYYMKTVEANEKELAKIGNQVYSIYGEKPYSRNAASSFYSGLANTLGNTESTLLNAAEMSTDLGEAVKNYLLTGKFKSDEGVIDKLASRERALGLADKSPSQETTENPYGFEGITSGLGSAAGSMIQYSLLGIPAVGAIEGTLGKQALGLLKSEKAVALWGMGSAGFVLNSGDAYTSARQAGLPEEDAAVLGTVTGLLATALELKFGANILGQWLVGAKGNKVLQKFILEETGGKLEKEALDKASGRILAKAFNAVTNFTKIPGVGQAAEEATEEFGQALVQSTNEVLYDNIFGGDKKVGEGKFGTQFNEKTWKDAFFQAAIGALAGGIGGVLATREIEKSNNIYEAIQAGKINEVQASLESLYGQDKLTEAQFKAYSERVKALDNLWNKNSEVFKDIRDNKVLSTEVLNNIESTFNTKKEIENLNNEISQVQSDKVLSEVTKEQKIIGLKERIENKELEVSFRNEYLKNFVPDETGKTKVLSSPELVDKTVKNLEYRIFQHKYFLDKNTRLLDNNKLLLEVEQNKEKQRILKTLIQYYEGTVDNYQKKITEFSEALNKRKQDIKNGSPIETSIPVEAGTSTDTTEPAPVETTGKVRTLQKLEKETPESGYTEYQILSSKKDKSTGNIQYTVSTPQGPKVLNSDDGYKEVGAYTVPEESKTESTKEEVYPDQMVSLFKFNWANEVSQAQEESTIKGVPVEDVYKSNPSKYPAHNFKPILDQVLSRPDWKNHVNLIARKVKETEFQKKDNSISLSTKGLRGQRKAGVHILMEVTNPETKEKITLFHPYNPDFYQVENKGSWSTLDFSTITFEDFQKYFKFRGEVFSEEEQEEKFNTFVQNWKELKEFTAKVEKYSQEQGKSTVLIPKEFYDIKLTPDFDFIDTKDASPLKGSSLDKLPIVNIAPYSSYSSSIVQDAELPTDVSYSYESDGLFVYYKHPNGENLFVRVLPGTKKIDKELLSTIERVQDELKETPVKAGNTEAKKIVDQLDVYFKTRDPRVNIKFWFETPPSAVNSNGEQSYSLTLRVSFSEGNKLNSKYYILQDKITDIKQITDVINTKLHITDFDGNNIPIVLDKDGIRQNIPYSTLTSGTPDEIRNKLLLSTSDNIVKGWVIKFDFHPGNIELKPIETVVDNTEELIQKDLEALKKNKGAELTPEEENLIRGAYQEKDLFEGFTEEQRKAAQDDTELKVSSTSNIENPVTYSDAFLWISSHLPKTTQLKDISNILINREYTGVPVGAVIGKSIYLRQVGDKSDLYHEAFELVLNNILEPGKASIYREKAKQEMSSEAQKVDFGTKRLNPIYSSLSDEQLREKVLNDYLSDKYSDWQLKKDEKRSIWKDLFQRILDFVNYVFNNQSLNLLFSKIDRGAFISSDIRDFKNEEFKLIPRLNPVASKNLISIYTAKLFSTRNIEQAYSELVNDYNPVSPANKKFLEGKNSEALTMAGYYGILIRPDVKALIIEQAQKTLKSFNFSEEIEDLEQEDTGEISIEKQQEFDRSSMEYNPADGVNPAIRNFIGSILFDDTDVFGREVKTMLSWREVWNSMLPSLSISSVPSNKMMNKMKYLSRWNPKIKAVYNKIGDNEQWVRAFQSAFNLDKFQYPKAIWENNDSVVLIENLRDLGEHKYNQWNNFYKINLDKLGRNKQELQRVTSNLDKAISNLERPEKNKRNISTLKHALDEIGITLTEGYLNTSFPQDSEAQEIKENSNPDSTFISTQDLRLYVLSPLRNLQDIFSGDRDDIKGSSGKFAKIAETDATFDSDVFLKTYPTAEGKVRYSYAKPSLYSLSVRELKDKLSSKRRVQAFIDTNPEYYKYSPLFNKSPEWIVSWVENIDNSLSHDFEVRTEDDSEGVTSKSITSNDVLFMTHLYFNNQKNNYSRIWLTQMADASTQHSQNLPLQVYYKDSKFTEQAEKDLWGFFMQEVNRINGVYGENFINKNSFIIYNFLNAPEHSTVVQKALVNPGEVKEQILDLIKKKITEDVNTYQKLLEAQGLTSLILSDRKYQNLTEGPKKAYNDFQEYLYNFLLNDFLMSTAYLQVVGGDFGYTKNYDDFIKRAKKFIASGEDFGPGNHKVQYISQAVSYINPSTLERSKEPKEGFTEKNKDDDGQVHSNVKSYLEDLRKQNLLDSEGKKEAVLQRMIGTWDSPPDYPSTKEKLEAGIDLIPSKQVIVGFTNADGVQVPVYTKCSVRYISQEQVAYWDRGTKSYKPRPGKEMLFNMLKFMDLSDITHLVPPDASKQFFPKNPIDLESFKQEVTPEHKNFRLYEIPDKYRRLQQKNATSGKDRIIDSNQKTNILGSELSSEEGKRLREEYNTANSKMRRQEFDFVSSLLVSKTNPKERAKLEPIIKAWKNILESSSPDLNLIELIDLNKYDSNLSHLDKKFQQLFLSTFKEAFRQQVQGRKLTLTSSAFEQIQTDLEGNYITSEMFDSNPQEYSDTAKYPVRDLRGTQFIKNNEGEVIKVIPAEVLIPRKYAELANLKVGDTMTKDLFRMVATRIPTQSYHSTSLAQVAGFLPDEYGDTIVGPAEWVYLTGLDYDIDKMYTYMPDWYKNSKEEIVLHGTEGTPEGKFEGYIEDLLKNNKYFSSTLNEYLSNDPAYQLYSKKAGLSDDIQDIPLPDLLKFILGENKSKLYNKNLERTLKYYNLPGTPEKLQSSGYETHGALYNKMFNSMYQMLQLPELETAFKQPLSTKKTEEAVKQAKFKEQQKPGISNDILAKLYAFKNATNSIRLRGIVVNANTGIQYLTEKKVSLSPEYHLSFDGKTLSTFDTTPEVTRDKFDTISTIVGSIIDDLKEMTSATLNRNTLTLGKEVILHGLGANKETVTNFFLQPVITDIISYFGKSKLLNTVEQEADVVKKRTEDVENKLLSLGLIKDQIDTLGTDIDNKKLLDALTYSQTSKVSPETYKNKDAIEYYSTQFKVLKVFDILRKIDTYGTSPLVQILAFNNQLAGDFNHLDRRLDSWNLLQGTETREPVFESWEDKIFTGTNLINYNNALRAGQALALYRIERTPFFKNLKSEVQRFLKGSRDNSTYLSRSLLSAVQMAVLRKQHGADFIDFAYLLDNDNPNNLGAKILEEQLKPNSKFNLLLKVLNVKKPGTKGNETKYPLVQTDSRSKLSQEVQELLSDSALALARVNYKIGDTETNLANEMYKYQVFKNNLQFTPNDFIRFLPAEFFSIVTQGTKRLNQVLSQDKLDEAAFKEATGMSSKEFIDEFKENFSRFSPNIFRFRERSYKDPEFKFDMTATGYLATKKEDTKSEFPDYVKLGSKRGESIGSIYKKIKDTGDTAEYISVTRYGDYNRLPFALTPVNNQKFQQEYDKKVVINQKNPGSTKIQGIEISSNSKGLGAALTNPTELAVKKGNLKLSYPVKFEGKEYPDAETAYQANKGRYTTKGQGPGSTYELMVKILTNKLTMYPQLVQEIKANGGSPWILASTHQPTSANSVWETKGQNWFIQALNEAYTKVSTPSTSEERSPSNEAVMSSGKDYTNYSGAATGGDTAWEQEGKKFGITQVNYVTSTLKQLTKEQRDEVEAAYRKAVKDLDRGILAYDWNNPDAKDANGKSIYYAGGLVRRDYLQAKAGDSIFAISTIIEPGAKDKKGYVNKTNHQVVEGGTGYAVQMGINLGKPVFVFDQNKKQWYTWKDNSFVPTETPTLTKKFTGIGTREINEAGKQAIKDVYQKTFGTQGTSEPQFSKSTLLTKEGAEKRDRIEFLESENLRYRKLLEESPETVESEIGEEGLWDIIRSNDEEIQTLTQELEKETIIPVQETEDSRIALDLIRSLKERTSISGSIITPEEAQELLKGTKRGYNGESAFYYKGETYYVQGKFGVSEVFHETSHPLVDILFEHNRPLFENLVKEVLSTKDGKDINSLVNSEYTDNFSDTDRLKETLVRSIEQAAMKEDSSSPFVKAVKKFFEAVKQVLRRLFGTEVVNLHKLGLNTTIKDLAQMLKIRKIDLSEVQQGDPQFKKVEAEEQVQEPEVKNQVSSLAGDIKVFLEKKLAFLQKAEVKNKVAKENQIKRLLEQLKALDEVKSINTFIEDSYEKIELAKEQFNSLIKNKDTLDRHEIIEKLTAFNDFATGYDILDEISKADIEDLFQNPGEPGSVRNKLVLAISDRDLIKQRYISQGLPLLADFLLEQKSSKLDANVQKRIDGIQKRIDFINASSNSQKYKEKRVKEEQEVIDKLRGFSLDKTTLVRQLQVAAKDEGALDFLFSPLISSEDTPLALFAKSIKDKLEDARVQDIEFAQKAKPEYLKYLKTNSNIDNPSKFNSGIYEEIETPVTDKEGKTTFVKKLAFVQKYNITQFERAKAKFFEELGSEPEDYGAQIERRKKIGKWFSENTQGKSEEERAKIISDKQGELESGIITLDEFKEWKNSRINVYQGVPSYRYELAEPSDKYLNKSYESLQKPENKDKLEYYNFLLESYLKAQENLPEAFRRGYILPSIQKGNIERLQSTGIKDTVLMNLKEASIKQSWDTEYGLAGLTEEEAKFLPVFYTQYMEAKDVSTDLMSSILRFNSMSNRYKALSEISGEISLMKNVIRERKTLLTNSKGQNIVDAFARKMGYEEYIRKNGESFNQKHLDAFIDMVVYGEMQKAEEIFGLDAGKLTNTFTGISAVTTIAVDLLKGVANNIQGNIQNSLEAVAGEYIDKGSFAKGKAYYTKSIKDLLSDFGKISPDTLPSKLIDLYDALQGKFKDEYGRDVTGTVAKKLFKTNTLFFNQNFGEHEIQGSMLFSILEYTKVKTNSGESMSLLKAYEKFGLHGIYKETDFTEKQRREIMNTLHALNKRSQGIYNDFDKGTAQRYALGRLAVMYRKHLIPGYKRRFKKLSADQELGGTTEGYYRTFWNTFAKDLRNFKFNILQNWSTYDSFERAQIRKTLVEATYILALWALVYALKHSGDDDKKKKGYMYNFMLYQATRMRSETAQYISPLDAYRVVKSPSAMTGVLDRAIKFTDQFLFTWDPDKLYYKRKTGVWNKGDNKSWAAFLKLAGYSGYNIKPEAAVEAFQSSLVTR